MMFEGHFRGIFAVVCCVIAQSNGNAQPPANALRRDEQIRGRVVAQPPAGASARDFDDDDDDAAAYARTLVKLDGSRQQVDEALAKRTRAGKSSSSPPPSASSSRAPRQGAPFGGRSSSSGSGDRMFDPPRSSGGQAPQLPLSFKAATRQRRQLPGDPAPGDPLSPTAGMMPPPLPPTTDADLRPPPLPPTTPSSAKSVLPRPPTTDPMDPTSVLPPPPPPPPNGGMLPPPPLEKNKLGMPPTVPTPSIDPMDPMLPERKVAPTPSIDPMDEMFDEPRVAPRLPPVTPSTSPSRPSGDGIFDPPIRTGPILTPPRQVVIRPPEPPPEPDDEEEDDGSVEQGDRSSVGSKNSYVVKIGGGGPSEPKTGSSAGAARTGSSAVTQSADDKKESDAKSTTSPVPQIQPRPVDWNGPSAWVPSPGGSSQPAPYAGPTFAPGAWPAPMAASQDECKCPSGFLAQGGPDGSCRCDPTQGVMEPIEGGPCMCPESNTPGTFKSGFCYCSGSLPA